MTLDEATREAGKLNAAGVRGKVRISGRFTFLDKDGNVVQVMDLDGAVPFDQLREKDDDSDNL